MGPRMPPEGLAESTSLLGGGTAQREDHEHSHKVTGGGPMSYVVQ